MLTPHSRSSVEPSLTLPGRWRTLSAPRHLVLGAPMGGTTSSGFILLTIDYSPISGSPVGMEEGGQGFGHSGLGPSPYLPAASCVTLAKFSDLPEPPPRPLRGCWETQSPLYHLLSPTGEMVREGLCDRWGFEGLVGRQWTGEEARPPPWWRAARWEGARPRRSMPGRGARDARESPGALRAGGRLTASSLSAPARARPSSRTWTPPMPPAHLAPLPPASPTTPG